MMGGVSLTRARRRWGRKARQNIRQAWKIIRVNTQKTILRWQAVSTYDTISGGKLQLRLRGTGAVRDTPLHIYDLSGTINYDGTATVAATPGKYMTFSGNGELALGAVAFGTLPGQELSAPGTVNNAWQYETTEQSSTSNLQYPHQQDKLDWVNVKLLLYGSQAQAVKYKIDFVQLADDWLDPDSTVNDLFKGADRNRFWFNMIKQYTYNPILTPQTRDIKALKVLRSYSCIIEPTLTIDQPADGGIVPRTKELNLFYRMNRSQKYDWLDNQSLTSPVGDDGVYLETAGVEQIQNPSNKATVHPKARIHMIIRALSTKTGQTVDYDPKYNPSYDIVIRKCHSQLSP